MALEGTFKDFHIADIVQLIGLQRKSGMLTLEGGEDSLTVTFQEGAVVWAQSARLPWEQRMAQILVPRGLVTPTQIQEAVSLQRQTGKKLRVIMKERGFLREEDWEYILAREVEEAVYRPFRWKAGRYRFVSQATVDLGKGKIGPLSAESLLVEGIRRMEEWPGILEKVPSPAMVFKVGTARTLTPKRIETGEVKMLDLVDGKRTVRDLVDASGLGEFEAWRSLAALVEAGAIVSFGLVPDPPGVAPSPPVAPLVPGRSFTMPPEWIPRVAWGMASAWLLLCLVFFHAEPLGLIPLSVSRLAALDQVRSARTREDLSGLAREVEWFVAATGTSPPSLEVLGSMDRALVKRLQDPWGHPYQIRSVEPVAGAGISVISAGPDGRIGTPDDLAIGGG